MSLASDTATQHALNLMALEDHVSSITGELREAVTRYGHRCAQRARGDVVMGHPRVIEKARKRIADAIAVANEFGNSADFKRISAGTAHSLKSATAAAIERLAEA